MYKVMIVDDEKFIRKSIRNRIDWEKYDIMQVEEAGNGEEALSLLNQFHPDVVLVDIRMPRMDGLAFITEAQKEHPEVHYIIMSAYSDFSYAKTAIHLGVEAYLLKPINKDELEALLIKVLHRMNEEKLSRMLQNAMIGNRDLSRILQHPYCLAIAFHTAIAIEEEIGARISMIVQEQAKQYKNSFAYHLKDISRNGCYVFLINVAGNSRMLGYRCAETVLEAIGNPDMKAAVSQVFEREQIQEAIRQSLSFLKRKMFYPDKKIITSEPCENNKCENQIRNLKRQVGQIYDLIRKGYFDNGERELLAMIDQLLSESNPVALIEAGIEAIWNLLRYIPEQDGCDMDFNILFHDFKSKDYLLLYCTKEELKEKLGKVVRQLLETEKSKETADVIVSMKEYIERNYEEPLNVADLARKYGLNTSYLSTLFKERVGINLTSYIEGIRMEKAKTLLKEKNCTVTEVAFHTGYSNSNYFSKVFKKYTGITPREFREL